MGSVTARWITGDTLDVLRGMPDASVDLVLSSPPFLALRSYLPADHPDKAKEIGSEKTPGEFIDTLLDVVEECRRVLAPHGSLCLELGDTYSGSGGSGGDYNAGGMREGAPGFVGTAAAAYGGGANRVGTEDGSGGYTGRRSHGAPRGTGWPLDKSLCMVPELLRISLSYGFNPLTGRETPKWRCRNVVRWCRPNPPVGALADKFRPATSDLLIACVGRRRYFDLDAVRTESTTTGGSTSWHPADPRDKRGDNQRKWQPNTGSNAAGAPPLDWWEIPTHGYPGSHYATWAPKLLTRPIETMCPRRVCRICGKPSERISQPTAAYNAKRSGKDIYAEGGKGSGDRNTGRVGSIRPAGGFSLSGDEPGWTDCGCEGDDRWRRGIVLDIFAGSGTTLAVAEGLGRDSVGIDLDICNLDLARERCGMFLEDRHDSHG